MNDDIITNAPVKITRELVSDFQANYKTRESGEDLLIDNVSRGKWVFYIATIVVFSALLAWWGSTLKTWEDARGFLVVIAMSVAGLFAMGAAVVFTNNHIRVSCREKTCVVRHKMLCWDLSVERIDFAGARLMLGCRPAMGDRNPAWSLGVSMALLPLGTVGSAIGMIQQGRSLVPYDKPAIVFYDAKKSEMQIVMASNDTKMLNRVFEAMRNYFEKQEGNRRSGAAAGRLEENGAKPASGETA